MGYTQGKTLMVSMTQALEIIHNCGKMQVSPKCERLKSLGHKEVRGESHDGCLKKIDYAYRCGPFP